MTEPREPDRGPSREGNDPIDWDHLLESIEGSETPATQACLKNVRRISEFNRSLIRGGDPSLGLFTSSLVPKTVTDPIDWGKLRIRRQLGAGSYGQVFLAYDPDLEREVALKLYRPVEADSASDARQAVKRLLKEGRLMARVRHPNVVTVHGAAEHNGRVGIWMDYVEGRNLSEWIHDHGTLSAQEAVLIGRDLCRALAAVHAGGIIHQDVKAQNVMREAGGRIVLLDFGVGLAWSHRDGDARLGVAGTPLSMAPECLLQAKASPASDVYSLGVLLFYLVTGSHPVGGDSLSDLMTAHQAGRRVLLRDLRPDLPNAFIDAIETAIATSPADRYQSMGEMEHALNAVSGIAPRGRRPRSYLRWGRGRIAGGAAVVFAAVAVMLVAKYGVYRIGTERPPAETSSSQDASSPTMSPVNSGILRPGEYRVEAGLYRYVPGSTALLLRPGDRVQAGDVVFLRYEATVPSYLYVISADQSGGGMVLWPATGFRLANPLPPDRQLELPGFMLDGRRVGWNVDSVSGKERLLLIASAEALDVIEADLQALPRPSLERDRSSAYMPLSNAAARRLRGISGLSEIRGPNERETAETVERLLEVAAVLTDSAEFAHGPWIRKVVLEHRETAD